jgi:hypothetical protein
MLGYKCWIYHGEQQGMVGDSKDEQEDAEIYIVDPTDTFSSQDYHQESEDYTETIEKDELSQMLHKFDNDHMSQKEHEKFMCMVTDLETPM